MLLASSRITSHCHVIRRTYFREYHATNTASAKVKTKSKLTSTYLSRVSNTCSEAVVLSGRFGGYFRAFRRASLCLPFFKFQCVKDSENKNSIILPELCFRCLQRCGINFRFLFSFIGQNPYRTDTLCKHLSMSRSAGRRFNLQRDLDGESANSCPYVS